MAITLVGETATHSSIRFSHEIAVDGDYAYFRSGPTNWANHVLIADVSDPENPSIVGDYTGAYSWNYGFAYNPLDEHPFLSSEPNNAVEEIETSTKSSPTQHDTYVSSTYANDVRRMDVQQNYLFLAADGTDRMTILDIADSLQLEGSVADGTYLNGCYTVKASNDGNYAFCTSVDGTTYATSINTSNKASPTRLDSVVTNWACSHSALHGNYFMVSGENPGGWQIIDVSDPSNLSVKCTVDEGTLVQWGTFVTNNVGSVYLFITVYPNCVVYDVTDWTNPVYEETISVYGRAQTIAGDLLYVPRFNSGADQTLRIYDISDYTYVPPPPTPPAIRPRGVTLKGVILK